MTKQRIMARGGYDWQRAPKGPIEEYPAKTCPWCLDTFKPHAADQNFCTPQHSRAAGRRRTRENRKTRPENQAYCGYCGEAMIRTTPDQKFCSRAHKEKASAKRVRHEKRSQYLAETRAMHLKDMVPRDG